MTEYNEEEDPYTEEELVRLLRPEKASPLHFAAYDGDEGEVRRLLEAGADVNARDDMDKTPLHHAVWRGHTGIAALLLEHGADTHAGYNREGPALLFAAGRGHIDIARMLLEHGADPDDVDIESETALHAAAFHGDLAMVRLLLEYGATVDVWQEEGDDDTPLVCALEEGHLDVAALLLEHGADIEDSAGDGMGTPLHKIAKRGPAGSAVFLLEHGAKVNSEDGDGDTPLDNALHFKQEEIVQTLRDHGAKTGQELRYALYDTIEEEDADRLRGLVAEGADLFLRDMYGESLVSRIVGRGSLPLLQCVAAPTLDQYGFHALHYAAYAGYEQDVKLLISMGVSADLESENGLTALDIATSMRHVKTANVLKKHSKRPARKLRRLGMELSKAAKSCNIPKIKELLAAGADPDGDEWGLCMPELDAGFTPLIYVADSRASDKASAEATRLLLEAGANTSRMECGDWNALHSAACQGKPETMRLLFKAGGMDDLWLTSEDWSVVTIAIRYNAPRTAIRCLKVLLEGGFTFEKERPFHDMRDDVDEEPQSLELARFLLKAGADINALRDDWTPLDYAIHDNEPALAGFYRANGGKTAEELKGNTQQ